MNTPTPDDYSTAARLVSSSSSFEQLADDIAAAIAEAREQGRTEGAERLFSALGIGANLLREWADHLEGLGVIEGRGPSL